MIDTVLNYLNAQADKGVAWAIEVLDKYYFKRIAQLQVIVSEENEIIGVQVIETDGIREYYF